MNHFALTIRFPGGGPLIGGHAAVPQGMHASHARRSDGAPYIPATALRGALRETLEAVLRGSGDHRACSGGDGIDPSESDPDTPTQHRCELGPEGGPCIACQMFGTRREAITEAESAFSGLVVGNAELHGEPNWTTRAGVSLNRQHRSAADQRLFFAQIPGGSAGAPLEFVARGWLRNPVLGRFFEAAVRATTHIGAGPNPRLGPRRTRTVLEFVRSGARAPG